MSIFYFLSLSVAAQTISVVDSDSGDPIFFATISIDGRPITSSDTLGQFTLQSVTKGKLSISAVGYKDLNDLPIERIGKVIFLESSPVNIENVIIPNIKGKKRSKVGRLFHGNVVVIGREEDSLAMVAKYFPNSVEEKTYLQKFKFRALARGDNITATILIYSCDSLGKPDKILNSENVLCTLKKGLGTNTVDISKFKIPFPHEGIFVAVNILLLEQNKYFVPGHDDFFYYQPSLDANRGKEFHDTWANIGSKWRKQEYVVSFQLLLPD